MVSTKSLGLRIFGLLLVFTMFFVAIDSSQAALYPPWYEENNTYRIPFNLTWTDPSITNLTVTFELNSSNVGSNFNFSEDRDSLRVVYFDYSTNTSYPITHYIENWNVGSQTADLSFLMPELIQNGANQIWLYYENPSGTNIEDYCSIFIYCDLFDDGIIDTRLLTTDEDLVPGTVFDETNGVLNITAGGADIWTGNDEYGAAFIDNIPGDIDVRVAILFQENANQWAKAGVVFRNDMTGSTTSTGYSVMVRTPGNAYSFQRDSNNNGYLDANTQGGNPSIDPSYVRLTKTGTSITGYYSKIDAETWSTVTSDTITSTSSTQDIGLIVTSHAGSTLSKVEFDNLTIQRHTTSTYSVLDGVEQKKIPNVSITLDSPSPLATIFILQNNTLDLNVTIQCNGLTGVSCGDINLNSQFNSSLTAFSNISTTSGTIPVWTISSQPQNCILDGGQNCSLHWTLNFTGIPNSQHLIRVFASSNISEVEDRVSENITVSIVNADVVVFNQSILSFDSFEKNSGDRTQNLSIFAQFGNHTNIDVSCISGDCSTITENWIDGTNLNEGNSQNIAFTCSDSQSGAYSATYRVNSTEQSAISEVDVSCNVNKIFGPMTAELIYPLENVTTFIGQNKTFTLESNVSCTGTCGNITAYAIYDIDNWFDFNWMYRQVLNVTAQVNTPSGFQVLLQFDSSTIGNNFDWTLNCEDIRFTNGSVELDYWVEECDTSAETLDVWIKTTKSLTTSENYPVYFYYGNPSASSLSDPNDVFIVDNIHLTAGRCPSGNGACNQMDNNAEADIIRENINTTGFEIDGVGYVSLINNPNNPYGADDNFYLRYRTLWIPPSGGSFDFGTASDDGSEAGLWNFDGYGSGLNSTATGSNDHDIVTDWYGGHGTGTCGSSPAIERTRTITANEPYWIDYIMTEVTGGQDAEFCIDRGSGYDNFGTTDFGGEFYARNYVSQEPRLTAISSQEEFIISNISGSTPLWTNSSQPQNCIVSEDGNCLFSWLINATGSINSSHNIKVIFVSNYTSITQAETSRTTINISDNIVPSFTLIAPSNNSKILGNGIIEFSWRIDDDDSSVSCRIYVDSIEVYNSTCLTGTTLSTNISVSSGTQSWRVGANDSFGNRVNSSSNIFTPILDSSIRISKEIIWENTNQYFISIQRENLVGFSRNYSVLDFVDTLFTAGSFTPIYDVNSLISGPQYVGELYGWNFTTTSENNYSISGVGDYNVLENYIVGGE